MLIVAMIVLVLVNLILLFVLVWQWRWNRQLLGLIEGEVAVEEKTARRCLEIVEITSESCGECIDVSHFRSSLKKVFGEEFDL